MAGIIMCLPCITSCKDEDFYFDDDVERIDNRPVVLEVHLPEGSRSVSPMQVFPANAMIHVMGTFYMDDGTQERRYGGFRYMGEAWEQYVPQGTTEYQLFNWPNNCVTAEFTAYYVNGANTLLVPTDDPSLNPVTNLSDVAGRNNESDTDPLVARSSGRIKYGHTIVLNFIHACSYLTVEDMPSGMSNRFWFTQLDVNNAPLATFKNAFRLTLNTNKELELQFVQNPDPAFNGMVYVEGAAQSVITDGVEKAYFGVFLPPGQYTNFVIGYPGVDEMQLYMRYSKKMTDTDVPDAGGDTGDTGDPDDNGGDTGDVTPDIEDEETGNTNPFNELEENGVYRFNLSKSAGVNILSPPPAEKWDDNETPIYPVDAEEFLYKICNPADYTIPYNGEEVKILQVVGNGTRLLQNVNMQWQEYDIFGPSLINAFQGFIPELPRGNTFDGNHHWIWNLGSPLFHIVNGTVKDLGITNADMQFVSNENLTPPDDYPVGPNETFQFNRRGAICDYLQQGVLRNIRIRAKLPDWYQNNVDPTDTENYYNAVFNINALIYAETSQESHNLGCLVGSNLSGTINTINITCDMNFTLANYPGTPAIPTLSVGGIIGQSVSTLTNVMTEDKPTITITNTCNYQNAAYYIGGIVGYHSGGQVDNVVLPKILINSTGASGFTSFIGGAVGGLSNSETGGTLLNCSVAGTVYSGKSSMNQQGVMGSAYTGGLAGECYESYKVTGCLAKINVNGPSGDNYIATGVNYGTGGLFGRIAQLNNPNAPVQTPENIRNITFSGTQINGPQDYIGTFAGVVPRGETWEADYYDNDILITYSSATMEYIGFNQ